MQVPKGCLLPVQRQPFALQYMVFDNVKGRELCSFMEKRKTIQVKDFSFMVF